MAWLVLQGQNLGAESSRRPGHDRENRKICTEALGPSVRRTPGCDGGESRSKSKQSNKEPQRSGRGNGYINCKDGKRIKRGKEEESAVVRGGGLFRRKWAPLTIGGSMQ